MTLFLGNFCFVFKYKYLSLNQDIFTKYSVLLSEKIRKMYLRKKYELSLFVVIP